MKSWVKLLPFFVVCWLARKFCCLIKVGDFIYCQPFGPGTKEKPEPVVLIELDVKKRNE
jgi:hypothetical protein